MSCLGFGIKLEEIEFLITFAKPIFFNLFQFRSYYSPVFPNDTIKMNQNKQYHLKGF